MENFEKFQIFQNNFSVNYSIAEKRTHVLKKTEFWLKTGKKGMYSTYSTTKKATLFIFFWREYVRPSVRQCNEVAIKLGIISLSSSWSYIFSPKKNEQCCLFCCWIGWIHPFFTSFRSKFCFFQNMCSLFCFWIVDWEIILKNLKFLNVFQKKLKCDRFLALTWLTPLMKHVN